ncbi:TetR/AcrR family transcriptional regulator [Acidobacteriota bacterium]
MKNTQSKKQRQIIDTARELFMSYGVRRISIEEICRTANVSKMTFYKYFKNKTDLVIFILEEIFHKAEERYHNIMAMEIPYSEKAKKIVEMKLELSADMSKEMLKDIWQSEIPEVKALLQKKMDESFKLYLDDFIGAQKNDEIRKDINPQFILYFLNQLPDMVGDERLLKLYASPQAMTGELINFFFYGILTQKAEEK